MYISNICLDTYADSFIKRLFFCLIFQEAGIADMVKFPQSYYASPAEQSKKTSDVMRDAYRNISSETIHKLWELYSVDYAMFNYPYPDDLGSNDNY